MEIGLKPASREDIGTFGIGDTPVQHQLEGKRPSCNNLRKKPTQLYEQEPQPTKQRTKEKKKSEDQPHHAHPNSIKKFPPHET